MTAEQWLEILSGLVLWIILMHGFSVGRGYT